MHKKVKLVNLTMFNFCPVKCEEEKKIGKYVFQLKNKCLNLGATDKHTDRLFFIIDEILQMQPWGA